MATPVSTVCPKCGHVRGTADAAPAWQCPACRFAYHGHRSYVERARQAVTPLHEGDPAPRWIADGSIWSLIGINALAIVAAISLDWTTDSLLLVYWSQSVIIGISHFVRILSLERFSTGNFRINNVPADPTPATKVQLALFFAMHYGFFHFVYLMFLLGDPGEPASLDAAFWMCAAAFAVNHVWSYRYNRDLDRRGMPDLGTLTFTPYFRILPMHVTVLAGAQFGGGAGQVLLFGVLKTIADVCMHLVEHARLRKVRATGGTVRGPGQHSGD